MLKCRNFVSILHLVSPTTRSQLQFHLVTSRHNIELHRRITAKGEEKKYGCAQFTLVEIVKNNLKSEFVTLFVVNNKMYK